MDRNKSPLSSTQSLENLLDFVYDGEIDFRTLSSEEVNDRLRAKHMDLGPLLAIVKKRLATDRLTVARSRKEKIDTLLTRFGSASGTGQSLKEQLMAALRGKEKLAVLYRKFQEASEEDIEGLIDDLNITEIMDDLSELT